MGRKIRIFEADCQHLSAASMERALKQTRRTSTEHEEGLSRPRCVLRITARKDRSISKENKKKTRKDFSETEWTTNKLSSGIKEIMLLYISFKELAVSDFFLS